MKRPWQVMVLGTGSHAGKSLIAAGLCRILSDGGWRVAPFKAQNMALNSAVADDGAEIGRAQWLQALASRVRSEARMNPVLLKPVRGRGSQLVLLGKAQGTFSTRAYFRRWPSVARTAKAAWQGLAGEHEALVIEGAGSPAEVNLSHRDLANLETARFSRAPFILVADIERGGAFAAVVGTLDLLPAWMRSRCLGVVFNKFRGDASLMDSGLAWLKRRGIRPLGVLPWMEDLGLDDEDSLGLPTSDPKPGRGKPLLVDVIRHRHIANFNDVLPLQGHPGVALRWALPGQARSRADLVILPGSKDTLADMRTLRLSGEAARLDGWRLKGTVFLGICGGFQMLGRAITDPAGVDGGRKGARESGLAWLDLSTRMAVDKVLELRRVPCGGSLGGIELDGYEIHHGRTLLGPGAVVEARSPQGEALLVRGARGRAWGTYLHGVLDAPGFRNALLARAARAAGKPWKADPRSQSQRRDRALARWADHLRDHLDLGFLPKRGRS